MRYTLFYKIISLSLLLQALACVDSMAEPLSQKAPPRDFSSLRQEEQAALADALRTNTSGRKKSSTARKSHPVFAECDRNKDHALSQAEFRACFPILGAKFTVIDLNHDGKISKDELQAYQKIQQNAISSGTAPEKKRNSAHTKR